MKIHESKLLNKEGSKFPKFDLVDFNQYDDLIGNPEEFMNSIEDYNNDLIKKWNCSELFFFKNMKNGMLFATVYIHVLL